MRRSNAGETGVCGRNICQDVCDPSPPLRYSMTLSWTTNRCSPAWFLFRSGVVIGEARTLVPKLAVDELFDGLTPLRPVAHRAGVILQAVGVRTQLCGLVEQFQCQSFVAIRQ